MMATVAYNLGFVKKPRGRVHRFVQDEREPRIDPRLFPEEVPSGRRPFEFEGKDVVFVSARVHPGETPASFVFQGILRYK